MPRKKARAPGTPEHRDLLERDRDAVEEQHGVRPLINLAQLRRSGHLGDVRADATGSARHGYRDQDQASTT